MDDQSWRRRAACRGLDPGLFYSEDPRVASEARAVCARCPVCAACRVAGATEDWGIWGGSNPEDRHREREHRQPGPVPVADDERLWRLLSTADPDRPALAQVLAALPVAEPTAYKYLDRARRAGLVERRNGRLYPVRR